MPGGEGGEGGERGGVERLMGTAGDEGEAGDAEGREGLRIGDSVVEAEGLESPSSIVRVWVPRGKGVGRGERS
jgi:hypothetical protein